MTGHFGKRRLTKILYGYLEQSAPEKLTELKREMKNWGSDRKHLIRYKKRGSREEIYTCIFFGAVAYHFNLRASKTETHRYVSVTEWETTEDRNGELITTPRFEEKVCYTGCFELLDSTSEYLCCDLYERNGKFEDKG